MALVWGPRRKKMVGDPTKLVYYPQLLYYQSVGRDDFVTDIVRNTTLTKQEAEMAIEYLFEAIPRYLAMGNSVQLGKMGYFKYTLSSIGKEEPEEVDAKCVKNVRIYFIPGKELRQRIRNIPLVSADSINR